MEIQGKIQDLQWACPDLQVTDRQRQTNKIFRRFDRSASSQKIIYISQFTQFLFVA